MRVAKEERNTLALAAARLIPRPSCACSSKGAGFVPQNETADGFVFSTQPIGPKWLRSVKSPLRRKLGSLRNHSRSRRPLLASKRKSAKGAADTGTVVRVFLKRANSRRFRFVFSKNVPPSWLRCAKGSERRCGLESRGAADGLLEFRPSEQVPQISLKQICLRFVTGGSRLPVFRNQHHALA